MLKECSSLKTSLLVLALVFAELGQCEYASLSLTTDISQREPTINQSYCAIYNPTYTTILKSKPDASKFHQALVLSELNFLGCDNIADVGPNLGLIVDRGNCTFYCKAIVAQTANASFLVVVYNETMVMTVPSLEMDKGAVLPITIPVLLVGNETGEAIKSWAESSLVYLSVFIPSSPPVDPSSLLLFCIAVGTILGASFLANQPFHFLRYGLLHRKGEEVVSEGEESGGSRKMSVACMLFGLVVMVSGTCLLLLLLYFFYSPMVYIVLALYCISSVFGLYSLLSPFLALIPLPQYYRIPANKLPVLKHRPDIMFFATVLFSVGVVLWWVVERHAGYAWILQDILGFAFIAMLLGRLRYLKVWFVAVLMMLLFVYDIFMVFITPYFTKDGVSVMEKAATGPAGGSASNELLPVVFLVPKLYYPSTLEKVCSDYITGRPASLLGYGDVGIPGLLVTLALRFDLNFRRGKRFKIYYATCSIAYIFGLAITYVALTLSQKAQPALLYLVPSTLGSVTLLALIRKEATLFFTNKVKTKGEASKGDPRRPASGSVVSDQGVESEGEELHSIQRTTQDEKQALISDSDQQNV